MKLVESLLVLEQQLSIYPWYTRVPSPSNCADAPSRNHTSFLELSGVDRSEVVGLVGDLISGLGSHIRNQSDKEGVSKADHRFLQNKLCGKVELEQPLHVSSHPCVAHPLHSSLLSCRV